MSVQKRLAVLFAVFAMTLFAASAYAEQCEIQYVWVVDSPALYRCSLDGCVYYEEIGHWETIERCRVTCTTQTVWVVDTPETWVWTPWGWEVQPEQGHWETQVVCN